MIGQMRFYESCQWHKHLFRSPTQTLTQRHYSLAMARRHFLAWLTCNSHWTTASIRLQQHLKHENISSQFRGIPCFRIARGCRSDDMIMIITLWSKGHLFWGYKRDARGGAKHLRPSLSSHTHSHDVRLGSFLWETNMKFLSPLGFYEGPDGENVAYSVTCFDT